MPYIKKYYDNSNCAAPYAATTATLAVPNINGTTYNMTHYVNGSKNICKAIEDLLTEANIAYTKENDFTFDIWGVKLTILQLTVAGQASKGQWLAAVLPYGQSYYPVYVNTANTSAQGRSFHSWGISSQYFCWWNGSDSNHVDFTAYLYYNENCICFKLRETNNVGGYDTPLFYMFKGTTLDNHNVALVGGTPCSTIAFDDNTDGVCGYGHRHTLYDLDDLGHTFGIDYRQRGTNIQPIAARNMGQFGNDYLQDNLVLQPISYTCYNGYVKIDNVFIPDYFMWNKDMLNNRIIEVNGNQYYIPRTQTLSGSAGYRAISATHPVAIKL